MTGPLLDHLQVLVSEVETEFERVEDAIGRAEVAGRDVARAIDEFPRRALQVEGRQGGAHGR